METEQRDTLELRVTIDKKGNYNLKGHYALPNILNSGTYEVRRDGDNPILVYLNEDFKIKYTIDDAIESTDDSKLEIVNQAIDNERDKFYKEYTHSNYYIATLGITLGALAHAANSQLLTIVALSLAVCAGISSSRWYGDTENALIKAKKDLKPEDVSSAN